LLRKLLSRDFTRTRISVGLHAVGTAEAAGLLEALDRDAARTLGEGYRLVPTGGFYQVTRDSNRLVASLGKSFALSLILVMGAIWVLFGSFKLTLVALVPNLIPLVWSGGIMGYAGIDLSTGTAMIAAVVIGLVVDNTIHYLARYRRERHRTPAEAVHATTTGTGRAMVISSVVLVLGFWTGCFGSFKPTVYFSLLTGLTMIGALLNDLLVLPACLLLTGRWLRQGTA
ncbi:MAG TPA: MMPL family transporter, partial [Desulfuromonadales bacterium]|nr:MMPL family transporter [Desulfuromonadales bacterium]